MSAGHTALPWGAQPPDEVDVFVPIIGLILGEDGQPLETPTNGLVGGAMLYPTEVDAEDYERAIANAAFIVLACNSHYELIEALQEFCARVEAGEVRSKRTYAKFKAILSRATGQATLTNRGVGL